MTETERRQWNAAVESGDTDTMAVLRDKLLTDIHRKIMTDDTYQGRTH